MKLLFLDSPSFGKLDLIDAFEQLGFTVQLFNHEKLHEYCCKEFDDAFDNFIAQDCYLSQLLSIHLKRLQPQSLKISVLCV